MKLLKGDSHRVPLWYCLDSQFRAEPCFKEMSLRVDLPTRVRKGGCSVAFALGAVILNSSGVVNRAGLGQSLYRSPLRGGNALPSDAKYVSVLLEVSLLQWN